MKPWIKRLLKVLSIMTFPTIGLWGLGHYPKTLDITAWVIKVEGLRIKDLWKMIKDWDHLWGAYWVIGVVIFTQWVVVLVTLRLIYEVIVYIIYGDKDPEITDKWDHNNLRNQFPNPPSKPNKPRRR